MMYPGPRTACNELDQLADKIGDPIIKIVNDLGIEDDDERRAARRAIEDVLVDIFVNPEGTISKIRTYIHELNKELAP